MADRVRNDANGVSYLEKDLGAGVYAPASVPIDVAGNALSTIGGGAITVASGADVTEGATADAAVVTNAVGTLSAKLRGLVALARKGTNSAPAAVAVDETSGGTTVLASNSSRLIAYIQNVNATDPMFLGKDNTVTTTNGIRVAAGETFKDERGTSAWKAITATGKTADVRVLEVS